MRRGRIVIGQCRRLFVPAIGTVMLCVGVGCGTGVPGSGGGSGPGGSGDDGNVFVSSALGFEGSLSGKIADSQTTRASIESESGQSLPPLFDTDTTVVRFKDMAGNDLLDPEGRPIDGVPVQPDGSFTAEGLPVGTDFTICADIGNDGDCDIEGCVLIPGREGDDDGELGGVQADPLTTLVLAKLRRMIGELGIDVAELPISPAAVATRVVNAYTNLFEESGIDHRLALEDIRARTRDELSAFFDAFIPAGARTGMDLVEGNFKIVRAEDAEAVAVAVAELFVRAGFPVGDFPGPPDLSALGDLDGIEKISAEELFPKHEPFDDFEGSFDDFDGPFDDVPMDEGHQPLDFSFDDSGEIGDRDEFDDLPPDAFQALPEEKEWFYISTVIEPDRNFANADGQDFEGEGGLPPLPVLSDHILLRMARLHLQGRQITLGNLYGLLTSLDDGLGARLTYFHFDPNFFGPPLTVFETADGKGKAINMEAFFRRIFEQGFDDLDHESFEAREAELRRLLRELLGDTIAPTFDRLFAGLTGELIGGVEELAARIRGARAHLPFNRSGPSAFFVVADGDPFRSDQTASAVTVDAEVSADGVVGSVAYNAGGAGQYYLGFTEGTDVDGIVELIVRETGRPVHGPRGPVRLKMKEDSVFGSINGAPFAEFVTESGSFFPGTHVSVVSDRFVPDATDHDGGPNEQLFVLATREGPSGEPVRVDYDRETGTATYNPGGRHLLMFTEDSHETGLFALFNEDTGRPAGFEDPHRFFDAPPEKPEGFEDFFNDTEDFGEFEDFVDIEEFLEDIVEILEGEEPPPHEEDLPPEEEGEIPPPEGEPPHDEGDEAPPEQQLPEDDGVENHPEDEDMIPPDDEPIHDFEESVVDEAEFDEPVSVGEHGFILVAAGDIIGLAIEREFFLHVFGTEVPNERYRPEDDPYFDDVNGNDRHDVGEPTSPFRPMLFDPHDWRSTDIRLYYRRVDNGESVRFEDVDFESDTPRTIDGVELVSRNYKPRLNAFRFGRPNTAINLLTSFSPPEFLNGTHGLTRDTHVDIFMAIAIINLVMDQVFNVEAEIDIDGLGPLPRQRMLTDAHMFVAPLDDPFVLLVEGFRERATPNPER